MPSNEFRLKIQKMEDGTMQLLAVNYQLPLDTIVMQLRVILDDLDKRYFSTAGENITFINQPKE